MPAPIGNQFALGNSGTEKKYDNPKELEEHINEYFDWCDNHPLIRIEYNGKDPVECEIPTQRPYTIEGLALHLDVDRRTLLNYSKKKGYEEYFPILSRAKRKITQNNIEFGLVGAYNANLVKFLLVNNTEYKDKTEQENKGTLRIKWDEVKTYESEQKADDSN